MNLIGARNAHFDDDGAQFRVVGANNYYAAFATPSMRGAVLGVAKQMGLNVLRVPRSSMANAGGTSASSRGIPQPIAPRLTLAKADWSAWTISSPTPNNWGSG